MPKSLGTLVTEVRDRLDEATQRFWETSQLRKWINEGARDIARRAEVLHKDTTIAFAAAAQTGDAPVDLIRSYRAEWQATAETTIYPLEYRDFNSLDAVWWTSQAISQGVPSFYTYKGFPSGVVGGLKLVLYPTPSMGGNVRIFYYRLPADLATDGTADATNVDVPEGWWDLIVRYAEFTALRKDRDPRWREARELYEEALADMVNVTGRWADAAGTIDDGRRAGLPAWIYAGDW